MLYVPGTGSGHSGNTSIDDVVSYGYGASLRQCSTVRHRAMF